VPTTNGQQILFALLGHPNGQVEMQSPIPPEQLLPLLGNALENVRLQVALRAFAASQDQRIQVVPAIPRLG
jgi:hypothetical protein